MKNDLSCAVVKDLLPSYVDGLTGEETNEAVETHLRGCEGCKKTYDAMKSASALVADENDRREVDYLSGVRKKTRQGMVAVAAVLMAVFLAVAGTNVFLLGSDMQAHEMVWNLSVQTDELGDKTLSGAIEVRSDRQAIKNVVLTQQDGKLFIEGTLVKRSFLNRANGWGIHEEINGVEEIYMDSQLVWERGVFVLSEAQKLYDLQTPYIGDHTAVLHLLEAMNLYSELGGYKIELQTEREPYGLTLHFDNDGWSGAYFQAKDPLMKRYAVLLMALVENLDEVSWVYTNRLDEVCGGTFTRAQANELIEACVEEYNAKHAEKYECRGDVKAYAASSGGVQELMNILDL